MSYNLLLDTSFINNNWKFINCEIKDGILLSTNEVFGISQEIVLPDPTKLYFRINYQSFNAELFDIKIGIQIGDKLHINSKYPKLGKQKYISVIEDVKTEKVTLHVIFESLSKKNQVRIWDPLLVDLYKQNKSSWLKYKLDKTLKYQYGYTYTNLYKETELTMDNNDIPNKEKAKIGVIVDTLDSIDIPIKYDFIENHYYLIKLDFKEINKFGKIYFKYNTLKSPLNYEEQIFLWFKAKEDFSLSLIIEGNDIIPYKINLKHLLLIDITKLKLLEEDIINLPFI